MIYVCNVVFQRQCLFWTQKVQVVVFFLLTKRKLVTDRNIGVCTVFYNMCFSEEGGRRQADVFWVKEPHLVRIDMNLKSTVLSHAVLSISCRALTFAVWFSGACHC